VAAALDNRNATVEPMPVIRPSPDSPVAKPADDVTKSLCTSSSSPGE